MFYFLQHYYYFLNGCFLWHSFASKSPFFLNICINIKVVFRYIPSLICNYKLWPEMEMLWKWVGSLALISFACSLIHLLFFFILFSQFIWLEILFYFSCYILVRESILLSSITSFCFYVVLIGLILLWTLFSCFSGYIYVCLLPYCQLEYDFPLLFLKSFQVAEELYQAGFISYPRTETDGFSVNTDLHVGN